MIKRTILKGMVVGMMSLSLVACGEASDSTISKENNQTTSVADGTQAIQDVVQATESQTEPVTEVQEQTQAATEEVTQPATEPQAEESSHVNPELKAFLDEYEAFMDKYVEFMQKYKNSTDTLSMLAEYADMMTQYTTYMQAVNDYDSSTMTTADSLYFLEVTTRVSQKLLEVQ